MVICWGLLRIFVDADAEYGLSGYTLLILSIVNSCYSYHLDVVQRGQ